MTQRDQTQAIMRLANQQRLNEREFRQLADECGCILGKDLPKSDADGGRWYGTTVNRYLKACPRHRVASGITERGSVNRA